MGASAIHLTCATEPFAGDEGLAQTKTEADQESHIAICSTHDFFTMRSESS
jgi:hypothetical protein